MTNVFFPRVNRQNRNDALIQHKVKPCFLISKEKEFHPHSPCKICFPSTSDLFPCDYEELGVRNLLAVVQPDSKVLVSWQHILQQRLKTLQVHWGQVEKLSQIDAHKIYVVIHQNKLDIPVLAFTLMVGLQEANIEFLNQNEPHHDFVIPNPTLAKEKFQKISKVLFIDAENSDFLLKTFADSLCGSDQSDVLLIPISVCYELSFDTISYTSDHCELHSKWKSNVRINFGLPHSFKDFISNAQNNSNMIVELKQHLRHDIWKNTPIMSFHVLSMILQYRIKKSKDVELPDCVKLMDEFQKKFRQHHDLAFVGDLYAITQHTMQVFSMKGVLPFSSVAADIMKLESLMMKSLFSVMDVIEFDLHSDIGNRVSQNRLLENYRKIAWLLRHEIAAINPPCLSASNSEKKALDYLIDNLVLSQLSDEPNSGEQQMARRIAHHLNVDSDEEEDFLDRPVMDTFLYVNIANALSHKWVATISNQILDVYYITAKQLLELRKIDVIEENVFIQRIFKELKKKGHDLDAAVQNAIKLFKEEGILESYSHSEVKILYLKDPFDETNLLRLVHDIAQFC
uniref:Uncharacterized protein n=1 Tax=Daphnia galeata TaxID=27404 RepID=A0A8J2RPR7_9CRUS|nr:unnamed protein product [Daphnia galeata]